MTSEPPLGAHLVTPRRGYNHHGIYVGDGRVVHYSCSDGRLRGGAVVELSIVDFAAGRGAWVKQLECANFVGQDAVRRARSRLGESRYRLLTNNCEHFCSWCLIGQSRSEQVRQCLANPGQAMRTALFLFKERLEARSKAWHVGSQHAASISRGNACTFHM
jgi:Lecithin retinol acyltransferase